MANLDIIEREGLLERGLELEDEIAGALRALAGHELVGEVRAGIGALGAVALRARGAGRRARPARSARSPQARARGVLVRPLGDARRDVAAARHHARGGRAAPPT